METFNPSDDVTFFKIALDCPKDDVAAIWRHSAATLAASKLCNDYCRAIQVILGIGPEFYAEAWLKQNLVHSDREFEDLVVIYFVKILLKMNSV